MTQKEFVLNANKNLSDVCTNNHIQPGDKETWWGYFDGDLSNAKGVGAGEYSEP